MMDPKRFQAFKDELQKMASKGALVGGAIGAGYAGVHGGLKEWEKRIDEDKSNLPPEKRTELQKRRLKRIGTGMALGAAGGALAGHHTAKWGNDVKRHVKDVADHANSKLEKSIDRLGSHYQKGIEQGVPKAVENSREKMRGAFWDLFRRKKKE